MEETTPHRRAAGFDTLIDEIRAKLLPALVEQHKLVEAKRRWITDLKRD